ncbi:MAG: hypothetical protein WBA97_00470 [Actinophytocola sp.]|uniref:hypothetical protein n=1 Tax=Actinophytocola sp. TaxID=1872138 RepID=UPI003C74313A
MSTAAIVILVVVLLAVLFAAGWFFGGQARSRRLRNRFGPEYDHRLETAENRRVAERELTEREKRHAKLSLRPLPDAARVRYAEQWTQVQERFVDSPHEAVADAEELVHTVMRERGYPMEGFEQQAADLSVEHASAVDGYRAAHEIRDRNDQADTESLRTALVHYREIFRELTGDTAEVPVQRADEVDNHDERKAHHA